MMGEVEMIKESKILKRHSPFRDVLVLICVSFCLTSCSINNSKSYKSFSELPTSDIKYEQLPNGKLSVSVYMLTGDARSREDWKTALERLSKMGVQILALGQIKWVEMEPEPYKYKWGYVETVFDVLEDENIDMEVSADIGMFINPDLNNVPRLPKDLERKAFDDPAVIDRLSQLYLKFLERFGKRVKYVFNHAENCSEYFKSHPDEFPKFQKCLSEVFARVKSAYPDVKTGVCIQRYEPPQWPKELIDALNQNTDVVPLISFGPETFSRANDPTAAMEEVEIILQNVGDKKIALHETSSPSSSDVGSSPELQATFVRELFKILRKHHNQIEFITYYEYADLEPALAETLGIYLASISGNLGNPLMIKHLTGMSGSSGLFTYDGISKPSALAWCEESAQYYQYRKQNAN